MWINHLGEAMVIYPHKIYLYNSSVSIFNLTSFIVIDSASISLFNFSRFLWDSSLFKGANLVICTTALE